MRRCSFIAGVFLVVLYSGEGPLTQVRASNGTSAQSEKYLCVSDQSSGFVYDARSASWRATVFKPTQKFIIAPSEQPGEVFRVTRLGDDFVSY